MKFSGKIGFAISKETAPGVHEETILERDYVGDFVNSQSQQWGQSSKLNDDLVSNVRVSIVSDHFARDNYHTIKYIQWKNSNWRITSIREQYPRLILNVGEVYNG